MVKKIITVLVVALAAVISCTGAAGSACSDPGDPKTGGAPKTVVIWIYPGRTKITKAQYGIWSAVKEDSGRRGATPNCRWVILQHGKVVQSGGRNDRIIIGTSLKGAVITMSDTCYKFQKGW